MERSTYLNAQYLANFGSVTFDGVGVTNSSGTYQGIGLYPHFYAQLYQCHLASDGETCLHNSDGSLTSPGALLASVGPISNDPNDWPYTQVKYTVTWHATGTPH